MGEAQPDAPVPNDGFNDFYDSSGDQKMADTTTVDISADCCEMVLEEGLQAHSAMMLESRGNIQSALNVLRHAAARKFNQEDPIEAAATEMILKKT